MNLSQVEQLAEYINQGRCALFVGPDLGESANGFRGLPTSWQLAGELAARSDYRGHFLSLPQIAQIFERKQSPLALRNYVRDRLGFPNYRPLPVHELIARIPFAIIVSGGWDTLLEQALEGQQVPFHTVRSNQNLPYVPPKETQLLLYKPYGSINEPASLLITQDDQLSMFDRAERVVARLKDVIEQYALLFIGYAPAQDMTFVRLYYEMRQAQTGHLPPAIAVQSLAHREDAAAWEAQGITAMIVEPTAFLRELAEAVAQLQGRVLTLPELSKLSQAPRLTSTELVEQEQILEGAMDQIGVADLVEQTDVPLLNEDQLRAIEAMRAAYERLAESFAVEQESAHVWLRQGNLEYARQNYDQAEQFYRRALKAEPGLAETYYNLHYAQLARSDWPGALDSYQRAVELNATLAILPERYQVEAILGGGGTGIVYRAQDTELDRQVAVKVLHRARALNEKSLATFRREAEVLQKLDHPHIVRLLDFQTHRGNYLIVMEYLEGQSLRAALQASSKPILLDEAFELINQVGGALAYAHSQGIIHRDVKPSNILLIDHQARLIDFGLARPLASGDPSLVGAVSGTIAYLAPEQARGERIDYRTDVYGLATVFCEMLTRQNPGQGAYRPPSELCPGLNMVLDAVIEKARERNPDDRYPTVSAFLEALRRAVAMQPASARLPLPLRLADRTTHIAGLSLRRGWAIWLGVVLGFGFILPALWPTAVYLNQALRYLGVGLLITFLLIAVGSVIDAFTRAFARRVRGASIPTYGAAMGLILGLANSLLWLPGFIFVYTDHQQQEICLQVRTLGEIGLADYCRLIGASLSLSLVVTIIIFLLLPVAGLLTQRCGRTYAAGFFITYLLLSGALLILGIMLPSGWHGSYIGAIETLNRCSSSS